jgi:Fe2+ or Zn2+ uptake regulation protein
MTLEQAAERFHRAKMRMTKPREQLLRLVLESTGPFSVKTLHDRAFAAGLDMHLATVHRNLAEFVEVGIVDKLPGEDNNLFAAHEDDEGSAHVFCLDCRHLVPLASNMRANSDPFIALTEALVERGFDASSVRLMLAAHCKTQACAKADGGDGSDGRA